MNKLFNPIQQWQLLSIADETIWEPLWRLSINLFPAERELLHSMYLRRLHYINHMGYSYVNTHQTFSRLQHTLGVFALAAYLYPNWKELRVAALLHDIGHAPFSHTLESIEGIDHHTMTEKMIQSEKLTTILHHYRINHFEVVDLIRGTIESPLRNRRGNVHIDHLDSWVRNAHMNGTLSVAASELLTTMKLSGNNITYTKSACEVIVQLMRREAYFLCSPINLGANTIIRNLVMRLISRCAITAKCIAQSTDKEIEFLLMTSPDTRSEFQDLLLYPTKIKIARHREEAPADAYCTTVGKLYISSPLLPDATQYETVHINKEAELLKGHYYVYWDQ